MGIIKIADGRYRYRRGQIDHRVTVEGRHIMFDGNHHRFPLKDVPDDAEFIALDAITIYTDLPGGVGVCRSFDCLHDAKRYYSLRYRILTQLFGGNLSRSDAIDLL